MSEPLVSIVTPTYGREIFLPHIYACVNSQSWGDVEWLIEDDSPVPSVFLRDHPDGRVKYRHDSTRRTTGRKRNELLARARGEYVVFFDDDDYYASNYVARMIGALREQEADFAKLSAWFLFGAVTGSLAYWDTTVTQGLHFDWNGRQIIPHVVTEQESAAFSSMLFGFGFSYVFKRSLWGPAQFVDTSDGDDSMFVRDSTKNRRMAFVADEKGLCLHILHGNNISRSWPQYFLPPFFVNSLFPGAVGHLGAIVAGVNANSRIADLQK